MSDESEKFTNKSETHDFGQSTLPLQPIISIDMKKGIELTNLQPVISSDAPVIPPQPLSEIPSNESVKKSQ